MKTTKLALLRSKRISVVSRGMVLDQSRLVYFLRSLPHNTLGGPSKVVRVFGGKDQFRKAIRELQDLLYQD